MRHPCWRLAGWLSITLSGCLHGQDWRAAVTKPTTRTVAERRESYPHPKAIGSNRVSQPKFVLPAEVATSPVKLAQPVVTKLAPQFPQEATLPPVAKPEPRTRDQQVTPVRQESPTNIPAVATSKVAEQPRAGSFAEFERTIPQRRSVVASPVVRRVEPVEVLVVENDEPEEAATLPVITPAGAIAPVKAAAVQGSPPRSLEPEVSSTNDRPQGLFSRVVVPAKEIPDVTDAIGATANDSSSPNAEPAARPQDVSVLVEQVFEDLRQRRMNDARQRTEWLKQLVRKRAPASPAIAVGEAASVATKADRTGEPRRLEVDPRAAAVEKPASEKFFDDEESTSNK